LTEYISNHFKKDYRVQVSHRDIEKSKGKADVR
jgi:UPF0042 nucleotide-binding protein